MKKGLLLIISILIIWSLSMAETKLAIKAGQIFTSSGEMIKNGLILIRGDKIEKLVSDNTIPPGYQILDYSKFYAYPGLINPMTGIGVTGISMVREWNDSREAGKYNPHVSIFTAFYPWNNLIHNTRDFGTLTAVSAPTGGVISGKAALVNLEGWIPEDMFIKKEVALIVRLPESPRRQRTPPKKKPDFSKQKKELQEFFAKSQKYYLKSLKGQNLEFDLKYEAMKDLWSKNLPVIVNANTAKDIKFALSMAKEFKLNLILYNVYEGEKVLKEIKESGVPVILGSMYRTNRKWEDGCDIIFRLPAALSKNGIKFAFSTYSASTAFDLPIEAGRAVAYGLKPEEAVKALTVYPAEILGIPEYGSLAAGKTANIVITNGDILETSTQVKALFVKGKKVTGKSFFRREFERARDKISGESK